LQIRARLLRALASRRDNPAEGCAWNRACKSEVFFVLPYNVHVKRLQAVKVFSEFVGVVFPISLKVAWTVQSNAMRKLYVLNWPKSRLEHG